MSVIIDRLNVNPLVFLFAISLSIISCNTRDPESNVIVSPQRPAQQSRNLGLDKSPMDMCYFPVDYPIKKMSGSMTPLVARIIYSRPHKDGRTIFGEIVKYGSPWRLGANEATEIEFFRDITIDKQKIAKGRYIIYSIPNKDSWTIILNNDLYTWGLKIDPAKNAYSFNVPTYPTQTPVELFTMEFAGKSYGMDLIIAWDRVRVALPIGL